jgi:uncharacterized protein with PIN domain
MRFCSSIPNLLYWSRVFMMQHHHHYVRCSECNEKHMVDIKFELENIEEDIFGHDIATFTCPETGKVTKSLVFRS